MSDTVITDILLPGAVDETSESMKAKLADRNLPRSRRCAGVCCKMGEYIRNSELLDVAVALLETGRTRRHIKRGAVLYEQGDESRSIYCVQSGHILLSHTNSFGHKTAFRLVSAGDMLGYRSFFGEDNHAATAQALSDTHVCCFKPDEVLAMVDAHPKFARQFLKTLAMDRGPSDALHLRGQKIPIRTRLLYLLTILEKRYGKRDSEDMLILDLPLSRRDIASLLGVRHESITRTINEIKKEGLAIFKGRQVVVPDWQALIEASNQGMKTGS